MGDVLAMLIIGAVEGPGTSSQPQMETYMDIKLKLRTLYLTISLALVVAIFATLPSIARTSEAIKPGGEMLASLAHGIDGTAHAYKAAEKAGSVTAIVLSSVLGVSTDMGGRIMAHLSSSAGPAPAPKPFALILTGLGLLSIAGMGRKIRKRSKP